MSFIVETGTFRCVTTEYFASRLTIPVFSIENNRRNYGFAMARLKRFKCVRIILGDSVQVLENLFKERTLPEGPGFFYLDVHWGMHLPLKEEVSLIFDRHRSSIVMIDDFEIPDDPGYDFDDYGENGSLTLSYLSGTIDRLGLVGFFPNCPSSEETGKRRGMIVITTAIFAERLRSIDTLREII